MDPDANLREQVQIAARIQQKGDELARIEDKAEAYDVLVDVTNLADRLAELVLAYVEWRNKGGAE